MLGSDLKQLVVLDEIKDKLEMLDSDIIPESLSHPLVSGIENVPTSIISQNGSSFSSSFTTFPLSPLQGRVNSLKDNFLNIIVDVNFGINVCENLPKDVYIAVGPRDTSSIFNQITLLIDNNTIWNTTYHQTESAIALAALPASVVDHNNQYATVDKLLGFKDTPMKIIKIPAGDYNNTDTNGRKLNYQLEYSFTIDLNRLCVPLSNINYITSNMGNLRLKVYMQNIMQSFYYFVLPASNTSSGTFSDVNTFKENISFCNNGLLALNPINWGTCSDTSATQHIFSNPNYIPVSTGLQASLKSNAGTSEIAFAAYGSGKTPAANDTFSYKFVPIQFELAPSNRPNGSYSVAVKLAEICQTCFDIEEDSWAKLCEYFSRITKVIIPIQQLTTTIFNNGTLNYTENARFPSTAIANVPANNISEIIIVNTPQNAQSCLLNSYLSSIQCMLDGKPINAVPYAKIDNRAITDFTAACVDTDNEEINTDFLYSLVFPKDISSPGDVALSSQQYFRNTDIFKNMSKLGVDLGVANYVKNPNLFMYVFQTELPDSFHTGMCILENTNRQALLRFVSDGGANNTTIGKSLFYDTQNITCTTTSNANEQATYSKNAEWVSMPNLLNTNTNIMLSVLSDSCIVLDYDNYLNTCTGGYISAAKPYLSE